MGLQIGSGKILLYLRDDDILPESSPPLQKRRGLIRERRHYKTFIDYYDTVLGFGVRHRYEGHFGYEEWAVALRFWFVFLLAAILPIRRFAAYRESRRAKQVGHCTNCGYDLRATPHRCPECGTIPARATETTPGSAGIPRGGRSQPQA